MIYWIIYLSGVLVCLLMMIRLSVLYYRQNNIKPKLSSGFWIWDLIVSLLSWYGVLMLIFGVIASANEMYKDEE